MFDIFSIFSWLKKNITRRDLLFIGILIAAYFFTRLIFLDGFPIFSDEGIYIHWAKVAQADASWRFISLTDGKQPLQTWGTIPLIKLFPGNALLAGRLFAVLTGFVALAGIFSLLYYLFGKKAAYWGSFFYIFTPFFLFYDRIALVDSGVNAGFIWILFLSIILARGRQLATALIFGLTAGIALLAKSSSQLFLGLSSFAPILFFEKSKKKFGKNLVNYYFLYGIGVIIAIAMYNIQRLSHYLVFVAQKNSTFVMTPKQFLETPFRVFFDNIPSIPLYVFWESGFVLPMFGVLGLILLFRKNIRLVLYLTLWILVPYIIISFFSIVLFPRYIIFFATLFLILASYFFSHLKNKKIILFAVLLYLLSVSYFDYTIVADYKNIPFPETDRGQYIEDWPAGWGAKEIIEYAREKSKEKPVVLVVEGSFGMAGDVLDVLRKPGDKIDIKSYWPFGLNEIVANQKELDKKHVFVVFSHGHDFNPDWPIKLIKKYDKPGGRAAMHLFELKR